MVVSIIIPVIEGYADAPGDVDTVTINRTLDSVPAQNDLIEIYENGPRLVVRQRTFMAPTRWDRGHVRILCSELLTADEGLATTVSMLLTKNYLSHV